MLPYVDIIGLFYTLQSQFYAAAKMLCEVAYFPSQANSNYWTWSIDFELDIERKIVGWMD